MLLVPAKTSGAPAGPSALSISAFVATGARIPIGVVVLISLLAGKGLLGALALTLFVALDIADGMIARAANVDNGYRRAFDSFIDRAVVTVFFVEAAFRTSPLWLAASIVALTNILSLPLALTIWYRDRVVMKAPNWHRVWSTLLCLSGLFYFAGEVGPAVVIATVGALCIAMCSADLARSHFLLARVQGTPSSD